MTTVSDIMTRGVRSMSPSDTVTFAAQAMDELNVGVIPVCQGDTVVGMVTDRDILVRGIAQQLDPETTTLADVMSANVRCAREDDDVDQLLDEMAESQIRRMPVVDDQERLIGIVSLGDVAVKTGDDDVTSALGDISAPSEPDRSGGSQAGGASRTGSAPGQAGRTAR